MTESIAITGFRALVRSGLIWPPGPAALLRLIGEGVRGGTNLATLLGITAARWPTRTALIDDDGAISYRELQSQVESLAAEVGRRGVGSGRVVGVLCRNGRSFVAAVFSAAMVGADVVLLNTDFQTEALAAAIGSHQIEMIICDNEFADRVADAGDVGVIDPSSIEACDGSGRPKVAPAGRLVLLTSGTTGAPKGVPRKPKIASALGVGTTILDRTRLRTGSRIALPVPMFHGLGFGMLVLTVGLGGTALTHRRFDAEAMLTQASEYDADALTVVPVMLARILDLSEAIRSRNPLPSLRVVISSGARLEPGLAERFMAAYGDVIYNGYGSSEVGIGALATPGDLRQAPETVGKPVVGCAVRILDESGQPVGTGVTGRVFVGGDLKFDAYTGGETKDVVADMMDTGDMGYLDRQGRLFIVGRGDDMIVSGGENVYPRAVENALSELPEVADNAVVGVPDPEYGERLAAFVVPQADAEIEEEALRKYLKSKVSRFEQPRDIKIVRKIPRNSAGKVVRAELVT